MFGMMLAIQTNMETNETTNDHRPDSLEDDGEYDDIDFDDCDGDIELCEPCNPYNRQETDSIGNMDL